MNLSVKEKGFFYTLRLHYKILLNVGLLILYAIAITYDLPTPAGTKYKQNIADKELIAWGATPVPSAQTAEHWWYKAQGLHGWSNNPEGWDWRRNDPVKLNTWLAILFLSLFGAAFLWIEHRLIKFTSRYELATILIVLIFYVYTLQIVLLSAKSANGEQLIMERIMDRNFTGYYNSALLFSDVKNYFSGYLVTMQSRDFCSHCRTHPPGPVLYYWSIYHLLNWLPPVDTGLLARNIALTEQLNISLLQPDPFLTAWIGGNIILFAAATIVIPLYGLARRLGRPQYAFPLAALGAIIPGILLMTPQFDQMYAVFIAWLLYIAIRGLQTPQHAFRWGLLAGFILAFSLYWSIGLLVIALPICTLFLWILWNRLNQCAINIGAAEVNIQLIEAGKWLLATGLGSTIPWILLAWVGKFPLIPMLLQIRKDHIFEINTVRPYVPWLFFNLVDFFQFLGLPLVLTVLYTFVTSPSVRFAPAASLFKGIPFLSIDRAVNSLNRFLRRVNIFGLLFWVVVILLDLSGTTRGEVSRLWLFLMPLAVLAVYQAVGQNQMTLSKIYQLLAAQFIVCALIGIYWVTP